MSEISIIGATTWGCTLAALFAANGSAVRVWSNKKDKAVDLQRKWDESNPGKDIAFTIDREFTVKSSRIVVFCIPSQRVRKTAGQFSSLLKPDNILVSASKGLEAGTGYRMSQILVEEIPAVPESNLVAISGPNLSTEINLGLPAVTVIASPNREVAEQVCRLIESKYFSTFISNDIKGVELCGALKNVIALGAGISDGLNLGSNAKAALVTVGWQEAVKLGQYCGAERDTFFSFAGLGDLVTTCISPLSRNYHAGKELARGVPIAEVLSNMTNVVEGVDTAVAVNLLADKLNIELPLMQSIYRILKGEAIPSEIIKRFLNGYHPGQV
jgi:glycerol-3-phosphate dehydrogenase (NAD(P)+)